MGKVIRGKSDKVPVFMRLEPEVAERLDWLVTNTAGSRGDVVKALVSQARLEYVLAQVRAIRLESSEAAESSEAVTDD